MANAGEISAKISLDGMSQVSKQLKKLSSGMDKVGTTLNDVGKKTTKAFKKISDGVDQVGDSLNDLGKKARNSGEELNEIGENIAPLSVGLAGIGASAVVASDNLNSAVSKFQTKLGASGDDLKKYEAVMQDVAKSGVGSFEEVADSVVTVAQNMKGLSKANLTTVTEEAMQLADVMGTDISEVSKVSGQLMKQFGIEGQDALDLIAKGYQNGMDYAGDYMDSLNEYSVYFDTLGFSAEDMFNTLISGAEAGAFNLDKVGDAVKEFGIRSKDGSEASADAFASLGMDAEAMTDTFAKGGEGAKKAYTEVVQALADVEDQTKRNEIGVSLFGTQYEDMEKDVIASTGSIVDHMGEVEGASSDVAKNNKTFSQEMQGYWNEIQVAIKPVGDILRQFIKDVMPPLMKGIQTLATAFTNLSPTMQKVVIGFGAFIAFLPIIALGIGSVLTVLGTFATMAGTMMKGVSLIIKGFSLLKKAFTVIKTAFTVLRTLFLANPFMLIVTGIVIVAVLIYKYWDEIVAFTKKVWSSLSEWFAPYWDSLKEMVGRFIQGVKDHFWFVVDVWKSVWNKVVEILKVVWSVIKTVFLIGIGIILTLIAPIYNTFATVFNAVLSVVMWVIDRIKSGFMIFVGFIGDALAKIKSVFSVVWGYVLTNIILPVIEKVKSVINTLVSAVMAILNKVKAVFKAGWDYIYNNVIKPIMDKVKAIVATLATKASEVTGKVKSFFIDAFNNVKNKVGDAIESVKSKMHSIWTKASEITGKIKGAFTNIFKGIKVPSFSLGGWSPSDLPKLPKMSVQWNAQGGILDSATFIGAGEAGAEAIVPLSNQRKMAPFAKAISRFMPEGATGGSGDTTINISSLVVREEADVEKIAQKLNKLQERKDRARGGLAFNG